MFNFPFYGELIAFCTTLSWTFGIFPFTEASRRLGPNSVNHFRLVLAVILLSLIILIGTGSSFDQLFSIPLTTHWLWFGLSGIVGLALGDYFGFTSFAILGTRTGSLFNTLSPGAALFLGYILVGEKLNIIGLVGMIITIGGVMWLTLSRAEKAKIPTSSFGKVEKGILFGILAALCQGAGLVLAKKGMTETSVTLSPVHATWIRMTVATIIIYSISLFTGRIKKIHHPILQNENNGVKYAVLGTLFGPVIGVSLSMYTVSLIKVSVAQTIFSTLPVVVLPMSYLIYREKITLKSILGALIAIIGVVILIWREQLFSLLFEFE